MAAREAWLVFEDESGCSLRPPRARTWGPVGHTPVVRVRGGGSGRVNVAGLTCFKTGQRSRLIYRLHVYHGRKAEPKSFAWTDYRDLILAAHQQLGGPIVLLWDNLPVHGVPQLRAFIKENQQWPRVFWFPTYAPELNPVEGIWSLIKRGPLANLAAAGLRHLTGVVKRALKKIQYRAHLIDGCLAETGLIMAPG